MASYETRLFINNEYVDAKSGKKLSVHNPVDGSLVTEDVHAAGEADVDAAVAAAQAAYTTGPWRKFTAGQRAKCMLKFADLVDAKAKELSELETIAMGQPISIAMHVVTLLAQLYRYYAGWADKIRGDQLPAEDGMYKIVSHHPFGVCAGIGAWNGSACLFGFKTAPAVASGNTFIYKMSEKSPLGVLQLGHLIKEAGFPPGVINILNGAGDTGALLGMHMKIRKISFTGSGITGRKVQEMSGKSNLKKVTLELGGKSPVLVFKDANLEKAVEFSTTMFLFNSGQVCAAGSRVYVQEDIATTYVEKLKERYTQMTAGVGGDPKNSETFFGPLADKIQYQRVMEYIESGKKEAKLEVGGHQVGDKGYFVAPTIFTSPKADAKILKEEIFGPVITIMTFKTEEEAIAMANDTEYGLAAYVWTESLSRALRLSHELEAGSVGVNGAMGGVPLIPFGGFKQSGIGTECGYQGIMEYVQTKTTLFAV